jgi:hypothetical protein
MITKKETAGKKKWWHFWSKFFGKSEGATESAVILLHKQRSELESIIREDGRVAHPVGQAILNGELETLRKNLDAAVEALKNPAGGVGAFDVGVGLGRLCDASLKDPKWALHAAVGTERCRTRVAKVLRAVEEIAERLKRDARTGQ